jgi:hypothetical protein
VQANGGNNQLGVTQTRQGYRQLSSKVSPPHLPTRFSSIHVGRHQIGNTIAVFELALQGNDVRIAEEKHYKLVAADQISDDDLKLYSLR